MASCQPKAWSSWRPMGIASISTPGSTSAGAAASSLSASCRSEATMTKLIRQCPWPHCGGQILPHAYKDPGVYGVTVENICHLCGRDPDAEQPDVDLVRDDALAGHLSEQARLGAPLGETR